MHHLLQEVIQGTSTAVAVIEQDDLVHLEPGTTAIERLCVSRKPLLTLFLGQVCRRMQVSSKRICDPATRTLCSHRCSRSNNRCPHCSSSHRCSKCHNRCTHCHSSKHCPNSSSILQCSSIRLTRMRHASSRSRMQQVGNNGLR